MHRLCIDPQNILADRVILRGEALRKARTVLRMRPNDPVSIFDGKGAAYLCRIVSISGVEGILKIVGRVGNLGEPVREIHLGQALPKSDKMTYIIQKAVELGVTAVHPFKAMRSVPRYDASQKSRRMERWRKVALEAAQQSGRVAVPIVKEPVTFEEVLGLSFANSLQVILHYEGHSRTLREVLSEGRTKEAIFFLVGPEGGFSPREIALARDRGFEPVCLGARILRTETVALTFLSIAQYEFGEIC